MEAKFIEVSEEAKALLAPFNTAAASSSVSGILHDAQFSAFLKKVEGAKGVDMLAAPRVTTRSGQEAKIEIGREFACKDADGKSATKTLDPKPAAEKNPLQAKQEASPAEVQANKIILPKVQFQEATLTEAVEFLRVKSRELDPEKKGMNILVKPGGNPNDRITMQLKDVPSYEALRYCAEIAGHQLSAGENAFTLSPLVEK